MATIKVTYNSIARRFNINSSTTWDELESKLRSLYNIPTTSLLTASYTDEDGDVITLSSDLELKEVLAQQSSGRPIKLVLTTVNDWVVEDDNSVSSNLEEVNDYLVEDSTLQQQQQNQTEEQTAEREEENNESRPPSYYQHASVSEEEEEEEEELEFDQTTTPLLNKEKEKETVKQHPESTKDTKTQSKKENEDDKKEEDEDDDDDEIVFIISHRPTFFGPRFGPFGGPRFGLFDGLFGGSRHCPFGPLNFYGRPQYYRPTFYNGYGGPSTYYFSSSQCGPNACGQKSNTCNRNSKTSCYSKPQQSTYCNKNAEASTSKNNCRRGSRPSCGQNFNFSHPRYYHQTPLTQEQLNDKLSNLHSMGFDSSNNALYEDLLKRYNGNLERVVELLLRNQQINEHYDNEDASISESKKVDHEGSKPYVL